MQFNEHEDDFIPRVPIERARSSCSYPLTHLLYDGLSRKSLSYGKLPQEPLRLTILKLDGSSFEVEVAKTATVAELKQAVEGVFSHFQKKGSVEISWSHVWGNFCLCYFCHKLLSDDEFISFYGIKDGDQVSMDVSSVLTIHVFFNSSGMTLSAAIRLRGNQMTKSMIWNKQGCWISLKRENRMVRKTMVTMIKKI
ncbi:U11/U12 small nuclear ribonucleoprotein 25 kDa protein-like isoform X2 [Cornus florida]|uniref:U11/U12 small nuclear ribonucleoprotein 25 kDa protein-like isoform X2 n=1 Tax=Cornus florida TaxID=4283 RepID=UPI002896D858|nr:U11/U12 small nuclear ribonucleoprotein 25 kDa protein-like isoform X2 [Cornus florida]